MKKSPRLNDPHITAIIFNIESTISHVDRSLANEGLELKDSQIKSCLSKVKIFAQGEKPKVAPKNELEQIVLSLARTLDSLRYQVTEAIVKEVELDATATIRNTDWLFAIKAVETSLKRHTVSGSRHYLDFLLGFIPQALGKEPENGERVRKPWWKRISSKT